MKTLGLIVATVYIISLTSCGNKQKSTNSLASDDIHIAIDETFRPIMEEELNVFENKYPEAELKPRYMSETDALNLLLKDSIRLVVATRELSKQEVKAIEDNYQLRVRTKRIATDGIALIVNEQNTDTLITMKQLKEIVTGSLTKWEQMESAKTKGELELVFDNPNSSTVRYIKDSVCCGKELKGNLKAQKTNQEVIDYVSKTRNAIGVIGVDWLRNASDSTHLTFLKNIRVMSVSRSSIAEKGNSFQPLQYYLATGDYPLTRSVYMITTDPQSRSMTLNLFFFVSDTPGQLIITKSHRSYCLICPYK
ncbi:MAG: substrate-binding domain-containing protein [Bacteroidaceae bacterium]